jgi:LmbE family N-acetylglucosaminyl deacetylase
VRRAIAAGALALLSSLSAASAAETPSGGAILQELKSFNTVATLLHVAAHPDDENTTLITYFARGRGYRTGYLSLTRGDGGQNELGPEFDEKLGLARTHELLAARELDGGRQFFTRAIDFGYSKSVDETLQFWDRKEVLGDVVRIIRQFRPDVIVTRFSPTAGGTHGHHTASAVLAVEAFKLASDASAYPEQLKQGLSVWQAKRVVLNGFGGRGGGTAPGSAVRVDTNGTDPVLGQTYAEIAMHSRRKHISQGFANAGMRGTGEETFIHLGGDAAQSDLFDGIDVSWHRVSGGGEIATLAAELVSAFKPENPRASVAAVLALRAKLRAVAPGDPVVDDKRAQLDRILQACLGLAVETRADKPEVVAGERLDLTRTVRLPAEAGARLVAWRFFDHEQVTTKGQVSPGGPSSEKFSVAVAKTAPLTQPYWLREEGRSGIARVDDPQLIGRPENPPAFRVEYVFDVAGQELVVSDDVVFAEPGPRGRKRRVAVIPPVSLGFAAEVSLFAPGAARAVTVELLAARAGARGALKLDLPDGWQAAPREHAFTTSAVGEKQSFTFQVMAPSRAASARATAHAVLGETHVTTQRVVIDYAHLPVLLLQPPARARLLSADVAVLGKRVGYLPGAGDDTADALAQLGYTVTSLAGADLKEETLRGFDAVVIGVRAFNERKDLAPALPAVWRYVEQGGTVIAQYNRPSNNLPALAPFSLSIAGPAPQLRVTDERAPVTLLAPDHPALNRPNKITLSDFDGWVQERGAYFPSQWDEARFTPLLAMADTGEKPLHSSVLIARHGKGHYVYTGLAFFRQLPAGVPGAYRLFANLVSLGQ